MATAFRCATFDGRRGLGLYVSRGGRLQGPKTQSCDPQEFRRTQSLLRITVPQNQPHEAQLLIPPPQSHNSIHHSRSHECHSIPIPNPGDALVFAIVQLVSEHDHDNGVIHDTWFRVGLRSAWKVSPFGVPGRFLFETELRRAIQRGLIVRTDDNVVHLTAAGTRWVETALAGRHFAGARQLREQYRASLWPHPPEDPTGMAVAA